MGREWDNGGGSGIMGREWDNGGGSGIMGEGVG